MCEKCGKGVFFIIYLLIVLAGSIFVMFSTICYPYFFPDDSIFKDDKILINYRYTPINYYPELEAIYNNYSNNIYYQRKYDLSFSIILELYLYLQFYHWFLVPILSAAIIIKLGL
jgi:hypothetical protein